MHRWLRLKGSSFSDRLRRLSLLHRCNSKNDGPGKLGIYGLSRKLTFLTLPMFALIALCEAARFTLNQKNYFGVSCVQPLAFSSWHWAIIWSSLTTSPYSSIPMQISHRIGANYQQLPGNASKRAHRLGNVQRDGGSWPFIIKVLAINIPSPSKRQNQDGKQPKGRSRNGDEEK